MKANSTSHAIIMIRNLLFFISIVIVGSAYSQHNTTNRALIVRDIPIDSLKTILKESFSAVNNPDNYKIEVTSTSEKVSRITNKTEGEFIEKNIERYLSGDTLHITSKAKDSIIRYTIFKTK